MSKLFFLIDFNHMGLPNKFGLSQQLDSFLSNLKNIGEKSFLDTKYELIRLGGDEFGGFTDNNKKAINSIKKFIKNIEIEKSKFFENSENQKIREKTKLIMKYAKIRSEMKKFRGEYKKYCKKKGEKISIIGFKHFLLQKPIKKEGLQNNDLDTGIMQLQLALNKIKTGEEKILTTSIAIISLPDEISPETRELAIGKADKIIHKNKELGLASSFVPQKITKDIKMKKQNYLEIENHKKKEQHLLRLFLKLKLEKNTKEIELIKRKIELIKAEDPVIKNVLRLNFLANSTTSTILGINKATKYCILNININYFGTINNNLGYTKGDTVFDRINKIVKKHFKNSISIRSNGGMNTVLIDNKEFNEEKLGKIENSINQYLSKTLNKDLLKIEAIEKFVLEHIMKGNHVNTINIKHFEYNSISIKSRHTVIKPSENIIKYIVI